MRLKGTMRKILVFTDLDGTLLDERHYSFAAALPALDMLRVRDIPLVLCSSKTRAEMEGCRRHMGNEHPFIVENGGGIFIPPGYFSAPVGGAEDFDGYLLVAFGKPHALVRRCFAELREKMGASVRGFTDMTVEEVAALTKLNMAEAVLARQRDFDEPFVFEGAPDPAFLSAITDAGLNWTQGRIFHIMGQHDKGRAVRFLKSLYEREFGGVRSLALGDGYNDLPMLEAVDQAVLVRHEDGGYEPRIGIAGLVKTHSPGPAGWNEAVMQLLSEGSGTR